MPLKMIELECPGCEERLELDSGFAGGVCRCHNCGTLMTVPTDASRDGAEQLLRPDRPGGQARRPGHPGGTGGAGGAGGTGGATSARPESPLDVQRETSSEVYTTASGRMIRVDGRRVIPTARKRQVARYATYAIVIAVVAAVVAVTAIVAWMFVGRGGAR